MRLAILGLTKGGRLLAERLARDLQGDYISPGQEKIARILQRLWERYDGFVLVMAAGIVVRTIAPLLKDKTSDPAVVVLDEAGGYAISLLSGHLGGGNRLAVRVAGLLEAQAVITTASDTLGLTALDLWAGYNGLALEQGSFTDAASVLVNHGTIKVFVDQYSGEVPEDFALVNSADEAEMIISNRLLPKGSTAAALRPRNLVFGVGCNRGTTEEQISRAVTDSCLQCGLSSRSIYALATIDLKNDEQGLLTFAESRGLKINFYSAEQLNSVPGTSRSDAVFAATGAYAVAEPAALLGAGVEKLLSRKIKWRDVTIAIAERPVSLSANYQ